MQKIPSIEELYQSIDELLRPAFTEAIGDILTSFQSNRLPTNADVFLRVFRDEVLETIKCTLSSAQRFRDEANALRMELKIHKPVHRQKLCRPRPRGTPTTM